MEFAWSRREQKIVRFFISSTFGDFEAERKILASSVFPKIRARFSARGITIVPIDLRWGLTEEQIDEVGLVDACLDQVAECYPFFLGLLGSRYGTTVSIDEIRESRLLGKHLLNGLSDTPVSITELEFRIGALERENEYALLFSKDPHENTDERVSELLGKIKSMGLRVANYKSLEEFASLAEGKIADLISVRFPDSDDDYDLETSSQEAVFQQHISIYVPGSPVVKEILDRLEQSESIFLSGQKGVGKSAALSYCVNELSERGFNCYLYYCNTGYCHEDASLLRRIASFLESACGCDFGLSDEDEVASLAGKMETGLRAAETTSKVAVFVDAVEQIESKRNLWSMLCSIFSGCDKVCCMVTGVTDLTEGRGFVLEGLTPDQIERIVQKELTESGRSLKSSLLNKVTTCKASSNPIMLKGILNELSVSGKHSELETQIEELCALPDVASLFNFIVSRVCDDLDGLGLPSECVQRSVVFLGNVRYGASESEILAVADLPTLSWVLLKNGLEPFLVSFDGRFRFSHQLIENAAREHTNADIEKSVIRSALKEYMEGPRSPARMIELASWALLSKSEETLVSVVCDKECYLALEKHDADVLRRSLSFLSRDESHILKQSINFAEKNLQDMALLESFCTSLSKSGCVESCISLIEHLKSKNRASANLLATRARAIYQRGDYNEVSIAFSEARQAMEEYGMAGTSAYALLLLQESIATKSCGKGRLALSIARKASDSFEKIGTISNDSLWCRAFYTAMEFAYGEGAKAEDFENILCSQKKLSGESSYAYSRLICYCWQYYLLAGNWEAADRLTRNSLDGLLKTSGEGPDYAWALTNRATVLALMGLRAESRWCYHESDRINAQAAAGETHLYSVTSQMSLILLELLDRLDLDGSERAVKIAARDLEKLRISALAFHKQDHPYVINIDANIAILSAQAAPPDRRPGLCRKLNAISARLAHVLEGDNPDSLFLDACASALGGMGVSSNLVRRYEELKTMDYVTKGLIGKERLSDLRLIVNNGAALYYVPKLDRPSGVSQTKARYPLP